MNREKRLAVLLGMATILVTGLTVSCSRSGGPAAKDNPEQAVEVTTPVAVTRAQSGTINESVLLFGSVRPRREVSIYSTVAGKVKGIPVSAGDRVLKDQILAYVERDEAGLKYADAKVESTISGIVKVVHIQEGASVTITAPLFQVVDMDSVEVVLHVPEKDVPRIERGMTAQVRVIAYPERSFSGSIDKLSPVIDPASRTREVRVLVPNPDHALKPGMFGNTEVIIRRLEEAVLVPYTAILNRQQGQIVYKAEDGRAVEVPVEIQAVKAERAAVKSGIDPGTPVIVIGQHNLRDGDPVNIAEEIP